MNYAALFDTIKSYVENDFPDTSWTDPAGSGTSVMTSTEQINTFIRQAEQRIYNSVELLVARDTAIGNLVTSNPRVPAPSDWLATLSFAIIDVNGNYDYLIDKDLSFIRAAYPNLSVVGRPAYYACLNESEFLIGPTPDDHYAYELYYYKYPESIVTAGNSWLGDNFDSVLLYGSLLEAYTFMKGEPDVLQMYQARYDAALSQLKVLAEGKNRQDAYRVARPRLTVQ